jgi:hypothetical protein
VIDLWQTEAYSNLQFNKRLLRDMKRKEEKATQNAGASAGADEFLHTSPPVAPIEPNALTPGEASRKELGSESAEYSTQEFILGRGRKPGRHVLSWSRALVTESR